MSEGHVEDAAVAGVIAAAMIAVCGYSLDELPPERRVGDLDIDSLSAAEIVTKVAVALDLNIDPRRVSNDWSSFSIADLGVHLRQAAATA